MPNPPGRYAFIDRVDLMQNLQAGDLAADLTYVLRQAGRTSPHGRMVEMICYGGHLMKKQMAMNVLDGMLKFADKKQMEVDQNKFNADQALIEFNCRVDGLGSELQKVCSGMLNADVDPVSDIAAMSGCSPEVIVQMASGNCILVPPSLATAVSNAATNALKLDKPLEIRRMQPNEVLVKPIGGRGVEQGKTSNRCPDTVAIRQNVLDWVRADIQKSAKAA